MSGILGMSELLSEMELPADAKEMSHHIFLAANTLMGIVNDLLDFAKLDANKVLVQKGKFSLRELVESGSMSISSALSKKDMNLKIDIAADLPDLFIGDEKKLRQVLGNILSNAVKFTASGDIHLSVVEQARTEDWYSVRFTVIDQGIGITEATLPKLFEPFVQADGTITRRFGGTGLGLSICRKLLTLMKGEIGVESKDGCGSTFWFMVPLELSK
jgi:two-component system, sensor histidine kinase and response regulator